MQTTKTKTHCWQPGPQTRDGTHTTCMLPEAHHGPHKWTRDDQIQILIPDRRTQTKTEKP
jgi:hypothetical protein